MEFNGQGAVVTGGGRGIGLAVARELGRRGARVVIASRTAAELEAAAHALRDEGLDATALPVDVADAASVGRLRDAALERLTTVDVLVNDAGIAGSASFRSLALEDWERTLRVNATGTFLVTQAFLPGMLERGRGRVVNVASIMARAGAPYVAAYAASKHAVLGMTRSLAAEVAARGVTVNAVCPGYVATEMADQAIEGAMRRGGLSREEATRAVLGSVGQKRLVLPEEVAAVVAFLASPAASGVTAQAVVVDGGGFTG